MSPTKLAIVLAALASSVALAADEVKTGHTDTQAIETIDTAQGVRLAVPFGTHTEAVYELAVNFTGDREKTVTLFEWVGNDAGIGMWERRSYFNTRFHGSPTGGTFSLMSGRTYLMVCHFKPGNPPPHNDLPWYQASMTRSTTNAPTRGDTPPSVSATYSDGAGGSATASVKFVKPGGVARAPEQIRISDATR